PASSVDYWLSVPEPTTLPLDSAADPAVVNVHGAECTDSFPVPEKLAAALLGSVPVDLFSGIQDLLLTALHASLSSWTGENRLGVSLEGHGRQSLPSGIDLSRTVGWFTAAYPVMFEADVDCGLLQRLRAVRDQRQRIPADGFEFGLLRYRHNDSAIRQRLEAVERQPVCFNYLGQFHQGSAAGGILGEAAEGVGREHALSGTRPHLIDINGYFSEGQLRFFWTYNPVLHAPSTIERLALGMVDALADLVDLARQPLADTPYAPSDFPLVDLRWRDCEALFAAAGAQVSNLYPLSRMQQGMLFHSQVAQEGGAYVVQYACSISGVLCADRFHAAWQEVVQRHEALRTCVLPRDDDDPLQIVLEHVQLPWCEQDWRGIDADTQTAQWGALLDKDRTQGFAMQSAPMMRCHLVRLGDGLWKFLWSQHHIVSDGWSLPIILADVLSEYHRLENRGMAPSPAPKLLPYVRWLQGQDHQTARDYWSGYLADLNGPTRLGWSQSDEHQGLFAARHAQLSAAASSALYQFARDRNTTINRLVELAMAVVIAAWTDRQDIVFGATVSGRPAELADVEGTVGMFINSVPLRLRWSSADTSFNDLLLQLQEHYGQRLAHEYLPFIEINELANLGARQQMFDCLCVFENFPVDESLTGSQQDFKVGDVSVIEQTNFPATLSVQPGDEIRMILSLSCDWFEPGAG
ncbi:MAG TPA: condensation domain-containing protein, partial [Woeseiaceae bacterium]